MLPKKRRLKSSSEISYVFRNSTKIVGDCFDCYVHLTPKPFPNRLNSNKIISAESTQYSLEKNHIHKSLIYAQPKFSKFAVVTSKQIGKAHTRNKVRRQLFALIGSSELVLEKGLKIIYVTKPCIATFPKKKLAKIFADLVQKIQDFKETRK